MVIENSAEIVNLNTGELLEPMPPGYEVLKHVDLQANGTSRMEAYVVKKKPENGLEGDIVKSAIGAARQPRAAIEFT